MVFRVLKPAYAETLLVEEVAQPLFSYPANEINETTTVGQTFISLRNRLCAIRVIFSCEYNNCPMIILLMLLIFVSAFSQHMSILSYPHYRVNTLFKIN